MQHAGQEVLESATQSQRKPRFLAALKSHETAPDIRTYRYSFVFGSVTRTITHTVLLLAGGSCYIVPCKLNSKEEVLETLAEAGEGLSLFRFCRRLGFWVILLPALGRPRPLVSGKGGRGVQVLFAHERTQLSANWVHLRLAFAQNN